MQSILLAYFARNCKKWTSLPKSYLRLVAGLNASRTDWSKNKLKLITDELVLDLTFIFEFMARLACLGVCKLQALRRNPFHI